MVTRVLLHHVAATNDALPVGSLYHWTVDKLVQHCDELSIPYRMEYRTRIVKGKLILCED